MIVKNSIAFWKLKGESENGIVVQPPNWSNSLRKMISLDTPYLYVFPTGKQMRLLIKENMPMGFACYKNENKIFAKQTISLVLSLRSSKHYRDFCQWNIWFYFRQSLLLLVSNAINACDGKSRNSELHNMAAKVTLQDSTISGISGISERRGISKNRF